MDITQFLGNEKYLLENETLQKFHSLSIGKCKEDIRLLEMQMLQPKRLPKYAGPPPSTGPIESTTIQLVFNSTEDFLLFTKHFHVNRYKKQNVYQLDLLIALLNLVETGEVVYNDKTKQATVQCSRNNY